MTSFMLYCIVLCLTIYKVLRSLLHLYHLANSAMTSTLTIHYRWEDETARERTGHPSSYAEAKKIMLLTLHTHGCPKARLRHWFSSSSSISVSLLAALPVRLIPRDIADLR